VGTKKKPTDVTKVLSSPSKLKYHNKVGTPDYMAPEVINPEKFGYDDKNEKGIDWWSMGVILYQFLIGVPPFCGETVEEVFSNIENQRLEWPEIGYEEDCLTPEAANLIQLLLNPNPGKRIGASGTENIKKHEFFTSKGFDWKNPDSWEPPLIPYLPQELVVPATSQSAESIKENHKMKENLDLILSDPSLRKPSKTKIGPPVDLGGFQMRRLDVLHHLNQRAVKDFQKKNSIV